MKQKSRLFLNIATIALCLCAIIVGVYSAKTASLNVGGQVGFVAHDCKVDVVGKITDASSGGTEGTYYVTEKSSESDSPTLLTSADSAKISLGGTNAQTKLATFGNLMFTYDDNHDPKPIVIEFTITNNSAFDIKATLATTNLTPYDSSKVTISVQNNEAEISPNQSEIVKLTITLDKNVSTDINNVVTGNITFDFEKCFKLLQYNSSIGWHINMGKVPSAVATSTIAEGSPIAWIPVLEQQADGSYTAFDGSQQANKPQKGQTYYFLSYNLLPVLFNNGTTITAPNAITYNFFHYPGPFHAWYYDLSSNSMVYYKNSDNDSSIAGSDYSVSNIRQYLNGEVAYMRPIESTSSTSYSTDASMQVINFLDACSLRDDYVYNSGRIVERTMGDLYSDMYYEDKDFTSVPSRRDSNGNTICDTNTTQKLWLLSLSEFNILKNNTSTQSKMVANSINNSYTYGWWLRTRSLAIGAFLVNSTGASEEYDVNSYDAGVRPAFKIVV